VERRYRALVHGRRPDEIRKRLERPVIIERRPVAIRDVKIRPGDGGRTDLMLTLAEGRYRIVRRLCEHLGLKVERLTRLSHGPVQLGRLTPGAWRYLSRAEVAAVAATGT
jgi:23S rRNA pseudouridine2605 synthase